MIEPITPASNEMVAPPPVFEEQVVSSEPSESQFTVSSTNSNKRPIDAYDPLVDDVFMGAVQLDKIHQGLGLNEFKLFFRLPDSAKEITSTLDLFLGYRANGGEVCFTEVISNFLLGHTYFNTIVIGLRLSRFVRERRQLPLLASGV